MSKELELIVKKLDHSGGDTNVLTDKEYALYVGWNKMNTTMEEFLDEVAYTEECFYESSRFYGKK